MKRDDADDEGVQKICSHSPAKGSLWVRCQPSMRFLRSCTRYRVWIILFQPINFSKYLCIALLPCLNNYLLLQNVPVDSSIDS
jgi:hypothetical protein